MLTKISSKFNWFEIPIAILVFVIIIQMACKLPLNYDEAYNLQVPIKLLTEGSYNTIYKARNFDGFTTITTGPTVLFPIFIVFKLFGISVLSARIINCIYLFGLFTLIYIFLRKRHNFLTALFSLFVILSTPNIFNLGITVIGELPALFFVFLSIILWQEKKTNYFSIIILGLAPVTKLNFLLLVIPLIIIIFIEEIEVNGSFLHLFERTILSVNMFLFPTFLWEVVKFLIIGKSSYPDYLHEMTSFFFQDAFSSNNFAQNFFARFPTFFSSLFPEVPFWLLLVLAILALSFFVYRLLTKELDSKVNFLYFSIFVYLIWWLFISRQSYFRYIYPFSVILIVLIIDQFNNVINSINISALYRSIIYSILFILVVYFIFIPGYRIHRDEFNSVGLQSQRDFSRITTEYQMRGYKFGVMGWWQAPEISFLMGGAEFINIQNNYDLLLEENMLVIYTKLNEQLSPETAEILLDFVGESVYTSIDENYILYKPKYH